VSSLEAAEKSKGSFVFLTENPRGTENSCRPARVRKDIPFWWFLVAGKDCTRRARNEWQDINNDAMKNDLTEKLFIVMDNIIMLLGSSFWYVSCKKCDVVG
jgi:hypothetical protein